MTDQQQAFVEAYLSNGFNAVRAAESAGYSDPVANACRIRANGEIADAIEKRLTEQTLSSNEILARLSDQATLTLDDFFDFGVGQPFLNLEKAVQRGKIHLIKGFECSATGKLVVKFHDAQAALLNLGRHRKLFTDKVEHDVRSLSDDELIRRVAGIVGGDGTPGSDATNEPRPDEAGD